MKVKVMVVAVAVLALAGCAAQMVKPETVASHVDPISIHDQAQFDADVNECTSYAEASAKAMRKQAIMAALIGGLAGAAVGSIAGNGTGYRSNFTQMGAAAGAAGAASGTMVRGASRTEVIIYNCLVHRGYALLY